MGSDITDPIDPRALPHRFFVAYAYESRGVTRFGNADVRRDTPIRGCADVREVEAELARCYREPPSRLWAWLARVTGLLPKPVPQEPRVVVLWWRGWEND